MEKNIYAKLFNQFEFSSKEHLDMFLQVMDDKIALQTLISAVKIAHERGVFHIGEVELISKSIRVLLEDKNDQKKE